MLSTCAKHYDGAEEAMRWHARGINTLVVTSGEMLQQLWSLIPLVSRKLVTPLSASGRQ
jgi:uroporphyrinogen-III synthase